MTRLKDKVNDFLAHGPIAVAGVSRQGTEPANMIYQKFKDNGFKVYQTNPKTNEVGGDPCYPDLKSIPEPVGSVMICTTPAAADEIVRECAQIGVHHVWMHRSFGEGSVSDEAVRYCKDHGISVIAGSCPMMFVDADFAHRCMKWMLGVMGKLPK
ncbi:MAG: CoA-binding protein [Ardenticatenaceae bacterium]|nr:CoA-binding protein [Ardenticatenaceae bacterium]